jgi:hypothetical protein
MVDGLMDGGEGETLEFGKAAFQTTDWTRDDIVFRATLQVGLLYVEVPGGPAISFLLPTRNQTTPSKDIK